MKFKVTEAHNLLRVFRLSPEFPEDYCFQGGHPVVFMIVDWFNAFSPEDFWSNKKVKEFESTEEWYLEHVEKLKAFIKIKKYFNPEFTYMVLTDYGDVFLVNPELRAEKLQQQMDEIKQQKD